jgi:predicted branched-subunit amino acid permease
VSDIKSQLSGGKRQGYLKFPKLTGGVKQDSFSLSLAVGLYGSAFGAAAIASHFSILQTCLLSLLTFSGASQFAAIGVVGAGGSAISAIATATLLGTRNALYGIRVSPILTINGWRRILAAQITIDESTAIATAQDELADQRRGFWYTGIGVFIFWNLFTLLGALGAKAIGNPAGWGLDSAVPAAFLALVWPRLTNSRTIMVAAGATILALLLTPIAPAGLPVIATVLLALAFGWRA